MDRNDPQSDLLSQTLARARWELLAARMPAGHWEGYLSASALSTATATFALWLHQRAAARNDADALIRAGARWLIDHQNADGGWGDTADSISNISTTVLCWAALKAVDSNAAKQAVERADRWIGRAAGSLESGPLSEAIVRRYGEDRTFSVPILTMGALADVLGENPWQNIPQLPFELAALPQAWFRFMRLPVVSYALPALIAMGHVRHHHRPTRNPVARLVRWMVHGRTLRVLRRIQPGTGGFLEATPLTSFVVMSLVGAGMADYAVVKHGVEFLMKSARPDGSWPIDTNLATWVTTLSINALAAGGDMGGHLSPEDRKRLRGWIIGQQYRVRHPYTGADPGGWAWTDLPGGVPDADDTAGALLALRHLGACDAEALEAACAGIEWLLGLQNRDGGIPTFCRGWGTLPFDRSAAELTAHALLAWNAWRDAAPSKLGARMDRATDRAVRSLGPQQRADGSWAPLWFGNQHAPEQENPTHGTSRVLLALANARIAAHELAAPMRERALSWLLAAQNADGGWGGAAGIASSVEETAQAVQALSAVEMLQVDEKRRRALERGAQWLVSATESGRRFPTSPIGLYFAKLWYWERLYPLIGVTAALGGATKLIGMRG